MSNFFVCDTNVLVSSLFSKKSPPAQAVRYIEKNGFFAFSDETFDELGKVLSRSKFDKFIDKEKRADFYKSITQISLLFPIYNKITLCRDPKDDKFLDIAIASEANYLITGDEDLLVLENTGNTSIITPREFIDIHGIS